MEDFSCVFYRVVWILNRISHGYLPRKFKRGIGSLFDPVLTLWGGGHIGSSRMEQSYCTSGFFRQRVNARNHSNYQPTPKRRSIIAYGKREYARRDKCVIYFIFSSCSVLRFPNFPEKGIPPFFPFVFSAVIDMSDPWRYPEHRKVWILYTVSFYLLIT